MRILKIDVTWSQLLEHSTPKLIVMRLDLENIADKPSNQILASTRISETLPSLEEHLCSPAVVFLMRVREGTMMGHIVEHVALELQELAGMLVGFGRTRRATPSLPGCNRVSG